MDELCDLGAAELRQLIGGKQISPVELLEACLARIARVNPAVNAVVALDEAGARDAARAAERAVLRGEALGPLHGLPVGIKDLTETAGLRTTFGSLLFQDHVPARDDSLVARLRRAGAIVLAKTNTPEFGAGANTRNLVYGATGNPFAPDLTCGGSSGGSAVALACGMVPLATGSDLAGSLRTPASFCGVSAIRPSPGLVASDRRSLTWSPLPVDGPMARNVGDVGLMLDAMAGDDPDDPLSRPPDPAGYARLPAVDLSSLRVALSEDLGFAPVAGAVRRLFRARCAAFADVFSASVERDPDLAEADKIFPVLRAENFLVRRALYERNAERLGYPVTANLAQAKGFGYQERAEAELAWGPLQRRFSALYREIDLLICPAAAVPPFPHAQWAPEAIDGQPMAHYYHWLALTYGPTLTGHPVVAVPCGLDEAGLPFGLQIVGPRHGDRFTLGAALALERVLAARGFGRPRPDLERLAAAAP